MELNWNDPAWQGALIALYTLAGVAFLTSMVVFVQWIRYSWIRKNNSLDYTGRDVTQALFNNAGISKEIKSSMWYAKYWNSGKKGTYYRLRPWTHDRKSIWTVMEASRQAYAEITRSTDKKRYWLAFRLPSVLNIGGTLVAAAIASIGIIEVRELKAGETLSVKAWISFGAAVSMLFTITSISYCWANYALMKHVLPILRPLGFQEEELRAIKSIFVWLFISALVYAIYNTVQTILRVVAATSKSSNSN